MMHSGDFKPQPLASELDVSRFDLSPDRRALIIYTSGTTGKPKGVVSTHSMIEAQVAGLVHAWKWAAQDRILHVLPLHHVHGVINVLGCSMWSGAECMFLPTNRGKFDAKSVWECFAADRGRYTDYAGLNVFMAVPTIYSKLIEAFEESSTEDQSRYRQACGRFRLMVSGSMALPESVMKRWKEISGHTLLERYGMTEIGMALSNPYEESARRPGYVGMPLPGVQVKLVSEKGDAEVQVDEPAELRIRGPSVFREYFNRPQATKESFDEEGYFLTGDVASVSSDGYYKIVGRASVDVLKSGGYKISALEVERELLEHPAITEVAVVGVPDEQFGQQVAAVAALKKGTTLSLESLREWCSNRLASYKTPRSLLVVEAIPRNAMGKVNKKELVKLFNE